MAGKILIQCSFLILFLLGKSEVLSAQKNKITEVDICVYGGTSAGVMAAYTAKKMGKSVVLIEPGKHLGGLTTGGLGFTDIGNKYAITGLARDYYRRIGQHYGKFEQWIFEPHVAENLFQEYITKGKVPVVYEQRLTSVKLENGYIRQITVENATKPNAATNQTYRAKMFLDCTYEGDLLAKAGVSYVVGREDNQQFQETVNGVQLHNKHQFPDNVDPYKIPGKPESGLLWGISPEPLAPIGSGDKKVQAYNFRICLTDKPENRIPITRPDDYDSTRYELLLRFLKAKPDAGLGTILKFDMMPNRKTDINNNGPFSTDMIGMNYNYPEADYTTRAKIIKDHENYNKGLLYFIGHDSRMPAPIRENMLTWGYPKDEYTDNNNWSWQPYVREARRMVGSYVMKQDNCLGKEVVPDGVGMAAYTMDSHNCQRLVVNGMVKNEGDVQMGGFGPYPVSYRSLIPKATECKNLLVPVCLSATHIAYGSIRMEPVFMALAQSAAIAASLAIDANQTVQAVDVKKIQHLLKTNPLLDNSTPEILVDNDDKEQVVIQGDWKREVKGGYGPSLFLADGKTSTVKTVRFALNVTKAGKYKAYAYFPRLSEGATQIPVRIAIGSQIKEIIVKKSDILVEGQTSGEWVALGDYDLPKGKQAFVEISTKNADGTIAADAVLFVPVGK